MPRHVLGLTLKAHKDRVCKTKRVMSFIWLSLKLHNMHDVSDKFYYVYARKIDRFLLILVLFLYQV